MEEVIKIIVKKPGQPGKVELIDNTLVEFHRIIECPIIDLYTLNHEKRIVVIIDDEGKLKYLKRNFDIPGDVIVGTAIFAALDDSGELASLKNHQERWIHKYLMENQYE